ncbi:MAG: GNAT family N-acetyltransferase [Chloroflexi bacterium]|nr:GNAT family N-acetyltransferase [Chloroflexota bacterium]
METVIRNMQIDDYEAALALWQRTAGMGLSAADEKQEIEKFLKKNSTLCFAAFNGEALIGTILCGEDGRRGYLYHLAVDEAYRKTGIGKRLVEYSLKALKETGIQKCHLFVIADNKTGISFWDHIGWELRKDIEVMSMNL